MKHSCFIKSTSEPISELEGKDPRERLSRRARLDTQPAEINKNDTDDFTRGAICKVSFNNS